ncbi:MAG: hypothetical protein H7141_13065 [Burkholderiales bacterium]|nr:hypothetical protein [Bacteroidia bacterium]
MLIPKDVIEVNGYHTWMGEDGIARTCVKPDFDVVLSDALENIPAVASLYLCKKFPLLLDSRQIGSMSYEARHHFSMRNCETKTCAFGIIINSAVSRALGNFYLGINKPSVPKKLFDNEIHAVAWLKKFVCL